MKKILVGLTVLAVVALVAGPAVADDGNYQMNCGNLGMVCNVQKVNTNTGDNGIANSAGGFYSETKENDKNGISTGDALSFANVETIVNSDLREGCCEDDGELQENFDNIAFVKNIQILDANTGDNGIANSSAFGGSETKDNDKNEIWTGYAQSWATAETIANSNLQEGCCGDQDNYDNTAMVLNVQKVNANTGGNEIGDSSGFFCSESKDNDKNLIVTGDALAQADAITIVNSNITRDVVGPQM